MTFAINNTNLITQPSDHYWMERTNLGYDGNGHPIYPTPRQYEMDWDWLEVDAFAQLEGFYLSCTGTCQISLPCWGSATGGFATYSATLREPTYSKSFEGFYGSVKFIALNVK
jgi:hypothetical protein